MKKLIKLTENDLIRIVNKVIIEQSTKPKNIVQATYDKYKDKVSNTNFAPSSTINKNHPVNNSFYNQMMGDIDGDNVVVKSSTPNKLVIDAFGTIYTITKQ